MSGYTFFAVLAMAMAVSAQNSGEATHYGGNLAGGQCLMGDAYSLPDGVYGTALASPNWDSALYCGACISVTSGSSTITAMVVDICPECSTNALDLFPDAYAALGGYDGDAGHLDVSWTLTDCPITTPLTLRNKEGTSENWFSMQVQNIVRPVESLAVSVDGGSTWTATERSEYNFFVYDSGFPDHETVDVKVTDDQGNEVTVQGVDVVSQSVQEGSSNFGGAGTEAATSAAVTSAASTSSAAVAESSSSSEASFEFVSSSSSSFAEAATSPSSSEAATTSAASTTQDLVYTSSSAADSFSTSTTIFSQPASTGLPSGFLGTASTGGFYPGSPMQTVSESIAPQATTSLGNDGTMTISESAAVSTVVSTSTLLFTKTNTVVETQWVTAGETAKVTVTLSAGQEVPSCTYAARRML